MGKHKTADGHVSLADEKFDLTDEMIDLGAVVDLDNADMGDVSEDGSALQFAEDTTGELGAEEEAATVGDEDYGWESHEAEAEGGTPWPLIVLGGSLLAWTAIFGWAMQGLFTASITPTDIIQMVIGWSAPAALLLIGYLLVMRNSRRENARFANAAALLRDESSTLEARLSQINADLTAAHQSLAEQSGQLEDLGRQSSERLSARAEEVQRALTIGLEKMERLDVVGGAAVRNLEQLREHLPVVTNSAKDVANQIGSIGHGAQRQLADLIEALKTLIAVGKESKIGLDQLAERNDQFRAGLEQSATDVESRLSALFDQLETRSGEAGVSLAEQAERTGEALGATQGELIARATETAEAIEKNVAALETSMDRVSELGASEQARLETAASRLHADIEALHERITTLVDEGTGRAAALAAGLRDVDAEGEQIASRLSASFGTGDELQEKVAQLNALLDQSAASVNDHLPAALGKISEQSNENLNKLEQLHKQTELAQNASDSLAQKMDEIEKRATEQAKQSVELEVLANNVAERAGENLAKYRAEIATARKDGDDLAEAAGEKLVAALLRVRETAQQAAANARETFDNSLSSSVDDLERLTRERIDNIVNERLATIGDELEKRVSAALASGQNISSKLRDDMDKMEARAQAVEARLATAQSEAEAKDEDRFTRQIALITDSLNSTAVDVTKLLSSDVTDVEWAAYLKGDRGIFARRAVRLLNNNEAREVLSEYQQNPEFQEHVNRYIHDFEAMLRFVLGTRDGNPVAVTLLSSDVGKLYVALAQAIDRLRN